MGASGIRMEVMTGRAVVLVILASGWLAAEGVVRADDGLDAFLSKADDRLKSINHADNLAEWRAETDITDATVRESLRIHEQCTQRWGQITEEAQRKLRRLKQSQAAAPMTGTAPTESRSHRALRKLSEIIRGMPYNEKKQIRLGEVIAQMTDIYSTATDAQGRMLEPDLQEIMEQSRDAEELRTAWQGWRDAVGRRVQPLFREYVSLSNLGARDAGYHDASELWHDGYDMSPDEFDAMVRRAWREVSGMYEELHCYVRAKLRAKYGAKDSVDSKGRIYAHLLGDMWAQSWTSLSDLVAPFPDTAPRDVTSALRARHYTPIDIVETAERFYESLGFPELPQTFWDNSMLTKPANRSVVCHPSAWDIDGGYDVRLKMCMSINEEDFNTVHHELGHVYYYMSYRDQPTVFQDGANDGFHEAVGDTIALSAFTDDYIAHLDLLEPGERGDASESSRSKERSLNFLMDMALDKVAFLPYGFLVDEFRWDAFAGRVKPQQYNRRWWQLRNSLQGVAAPVPRSDRTDFDPGAKFHIVSNVPYMRYFLAMIYQFQFHAAMCEAADAAQRNRSPTAQPLHECSVFGSEPAGSLLRRMLRSGSSRPWQQTLEEMTGNATLDPEPMMRYFAPLREFLREQNRNETCGWAVEAVGTTGRGAWRLRHIVLAGFALSVLPSVQLLRRLVFRRGRKRIHGYIPIP